MALRAAVRHRGGLVADRKVAQQRLHDQLNCAMPGYFGPCPPRSFLAAGFCDGVGGAVVCGGVRRSSPTGAVADQSSSGPDDTGHRRVLG